MKRFAQLLFLLPVLAGILFLSVTTLFFSDTAPEQYDPYENRTLASPPVLSSATLWDGSYFSGLETYLSDHIYHRTQWLDANVHYQLLRKSPSVNGVVVTPTALMLDCGLFSHCDYTANAQAMAERLSAIASLTESYGGTFLFVGVPTQYAAYREAYPSFMNSNGEKIDEIYAAFSTAAEEHDLPCLYLEGLFANLSIQELPEYYSPVDHHYTFKGAYMSYLAICQRLQELGWEFPIVTQEHITITSLPNPYLGTYSRKLYSASPISGALQVFTSDMEVPYTRYDNGVETGNPLVQLPQSPEEFVYYSAYMCGDMGETVLSTGREDLPNILIVGDSYTNPLEALFSLSCNEMRSLDLRYYTGGMALSEYIAQYRPDIVLYVRDNGHYVDLEGNGNIQ